MFEVWLQSDQNASWEKLIVALDTMEYHCLAQSVKTEYADIFNAQKEYGTYVKLFCCYSTFNDQIKIKLHQYFTLTCVDQL